MSGDEGLPVPRPEDGWVPEFEGQRPPFLPGHQINRTHGAYSPSATTERAQELITALAEVDPQWVETADRWAVLAWAEAEARCSLMREWLSVRGPTDPKGQPWPVESVLLRWERTAAARRNDLGLSAAARARLRADTGAAVAATAQVRALQEKGRQLRTVRESGDGS